MGSTCFQRLTYSFSRYNRGFQFFRNFDSFYKPRYATTRQQYSLLWPCSMEPKNVRFFQTIEKTNTSKDVSDEALFDETFLTVSTFLTSQMKEKGLHEVSEWFEQVLNYNVPHGKKNRGLGVLKTYKYLVPEGSLQERRLAAILGWCIEVCQAFFLVLDDIMDQSVTRRGMPCWFRQESVGLAAINDAILMESSIFRLLKTYFSHHPNYIDMVDVFYETIYFTSMGQCMDMLSTPINASPNLDTYTEQRHSSVCQMKTAYYTICLPVRMALLLAGKRQSYTKEVESLLLTVGHFFQVQDDYLDCFGDPAVTGKQGTDIEDGKCSWLIVTALQRVGPQDEVLLKEHYGKNSPESIAAVKAVYNKVGIPSCFETYELDTYTSICQQIESLKYSSDIPPQVFHDLLNKIYKRSK